MRPCAVVLQGLASGFDVEDAKARRYCQANDLDIVAIFHELGLCNLPGLGVLIERARVGIFDVVAVKSMQYVDHWVDGSARIAPMLRANGIEFAVYGGGKQPPRVIPEDPEVLAARETQREAEIETRRLRYEAEAEERAAVHRERARLAEVERQARQAREFNALPDWKKSMARKFNLDRSPSDDRGHGETHGR